MIADMKPTMFKLSWVGLAVATPVVYQRQTGIVPPAGFTPGVKWQIVINEPVDITKPLDPSDALVWDIDLYHAMNNPETIPFLHGNNKTVICYFNGGGVQDSDCDFETKWNTTENKHLLGNPLITGDQDPGDEFKGEFWINIKDQKAVSLIQERIQLAVELGCDGVDPDNIDGYTHDENPEDKFPTGFNLTKGDYATFFTALSSYAHNQTVNGHQMLIGQKNAAELTDQLASSADFAVLEQCMGLGEEAGPPEGAIIPAFDESDNFCGQFQRYVNGSDQGVRKPVFAIEYPKSLGSKEICNPDGVRNETRYDEICSTDFAKYHNQDFSMIMKLNGDSGGLNNCTQYCAEGFGKGVVVTPTFEGEKSCGPDE